MNNEPVAEVMSITENDIVVVWHSSQLCFIVKKLSQILGMNDSKMALHLGMQKSHYSEFLSGKRGLTVKVIRKLYEMGVNPDYLLGVRVLDKNLKATIEEIESKLKNQERLEFEDAND